MKNTVGSVLCGAILGFFLNTLMSIIWNRANPPKVHILQAPLLIASNSATTNLHLLPAGTSLYFDESYPEGFTRYKAYINIDRMPLSLSKLVDSSEIDPIEARALDKSELAMALRDCPLTRQELEAILHSKQLSIEEIQEVFNTVLTSSK
ncbi:MAG: hypothetical protein ACXWVG_12010 [Telluria sp.]